MLITSSVFNGTIGLREGFNLDTEPLPAEIAEEIQRLVSASNFFSLPKSIRFNSGSRHSPYTVTVTDREKFHEVTFDLEAISVPVELKNLVQLASQHAEMKYLPPNWTIADGAEE